MTIKRLEELKNKFESGSGTNEDIGEILSDLFLSLSDHMKEIKKSINDIKDNQSILCQEIEDIKLKLNPVYTIISENEDD